MKISIKGITKYVLLGASLSLIGLGLGKHYKDYNCPIKGRHKHVYKDNSGYSITLESEEAEIEKFQKQTNYELITDDETLEMENNLFRRGFVKIEDNLNLISYFEEKLSGERYLKGDNGVELKALYGFFSYKVGKIENGEYIFEKSPYVTNLLQVMEEYPYIRKDDFFELVNSNEIVNFSKTL